MFNVKEVEDLIDKGVRVINLCGDCSEILVTVSTLEKKLKHAMKLLSNKLKSVSHELKYKIDT